MRRVLADATGYEAPEWETKGSFVTLSNQGGGTGYFFVARGAVKVDAPKPDPTEELRTVLVDADDLRTAIHNGAMLIVNHVLMVLLALGAAR